jgi:hypothetical protein
MRLILAAILMGSLFCTAASAEDKPVAGKPVAEKPAPNKATPNKPPANKGIDYGDMRCGFAIRHRDVLDSQIIAWASGFIDGYTRQTADHIAGAHSLDELDDPAVLRTHIRGYCLKHKDKSLEAALLAVIHHPHASATTPAAHPAAPTPHPKPVPAQPALPAQPAQ